MKKICVSLSIASIILTSGLTFGSLPPAGSETITCPLTKDIQGYGVGITTMDEEGDFAEMGSYMSININNYGTPALWVFAIINIDAKDRVDAYKQANTALGTLSGDPKMTYLSGKGKNGYPIKAAALLTY
jgi:hypothetical protein